MTETFVPASASEAYFGGKPILLVAHNMWSINIYSLGLNWDVGSGVEEPDKAYGEVREIVIEDHFIEAEDSHFFTYFLCMAVLTIMAYLAFHNKKKVSSSFWWDCAIRGLFYVDRKYSTLLWKSGKLW